MDETVVLLTVGRRSYELRLQARDALTPSLITVTDDGGGTWAFEHAPRGCLSFGTGPRGAFLWTDSRIVELPGYGDTPPTVVLEVDLAPHAVFQYEDGWFIVFEDEVRRYVDGQARSVLALPDVVLGVSVTAEGQYRLALFDDAELVVTADCEGVSWTGYRS